MLSSQMILCESFDHYFTTYLFKQDTRGSVQLDMFYIRQPTYMTWICIIITVLNVAARLLYS